ncbi:DDE-type integrase/transposase/recombinase [Stappia sp. GBMRC 2046]|uniref:DDE-type integrase/transposase/recombinase n=1 Tax=Stappia sediminis TaxID=2692190 RepID=A0A7X3S856_9HYPH|nr:DDE-type integrase/transposase/recombinase [Stappia sediminis]
MSFGRASHRYQLRRDPAIELRMRLKEPAGSRVRYGHRRLHVLLRRDGWQVNHKRTYRLYSEEGLSIRTRSPRWQRACRYRSGRPDANAMNDVWAMDFMSNKIFDGQPFRILTIVDCHTREALATSARINFRAYQVADELDGIARIRGKPRSIRVDNGPEFAGRLLDQWAYLNRVELDFSRPGKPSDNAYIEAFNSRVIQGYLNASRFQ